MVKFTYHKLISNNTKKNCKKFIKPVILITSLMTFFYLVINTVNSNALVPKKLSDSGSSNENDQPINLNILDYIAHNYEFDKYNDIFIKSVLKELDLVPSLYVEDDGGGALCKENKAIYQNIITSFPGDQLSDFIWEYISLWSLSSELKKLKQNSNIYLTDKTINGLSTLFDIDCLEFLPISEVPRKCLNWQLIKVLKPTQILNLKDYIEEVPFILEKNSKRVFDIMATDLRPLREQLKLEKDVNNLVEDFLKDIIDSISIKMKQEESYKFVCSYIEEKQQNYLPFLKSSIEFHNREGTSNIFIFMVPPKDHQLYSNEFETTKYKTIKVFDHHENESFNVALLLQCDRTIILNELTLATALLNAGGATIPKDDPLFILFKTKIFNWYPLGNGGDDSE